MFAQRSGGAVKTLEAVSFPARLANAACAYVAYLGKTAFPADLAVFYPCAADLAGWKVGVCIFVLLIVTWITWSLRQPVPYLLTTENSGFCLRKTGKVTRPQGRSGERRNWSRLGRL
jgi:hypothetical protein